MTMMTAREAKSGFDLGIKEILDIMGGGILAVSVTGMFGADALSTIQFVALAVGVVVGAAMAYRSNRRGGYE